MINHLTYPAKWVQVPLLPCLDPLMSLGMALLTNSFLYHYHPTEAHWNVAALHGILQVSRINILTNYSNINAQITTAHLTHTNACNVQNAQAMYKCLKASLMGSLPSAVFLQLRNLLAHEDGLALWKKLTDFMSIASLQLSNLASNQIMEFNPEMHKLN